LTVSTQNSSIELATNGSVGPFSFNFIGVSAADISVTSIASNNIATTLLSSQYTLSLNAANPNQLWGVGGTVTLNSTPAAGTSLLVQRTLPLTQATSVQNQGNYYAQVTEQALDLLEMQIQQVSSRTSQFRGTWQTNTAYNVGDIVQDGANGSDTLNYYVCAIGNISGVWATDLSAGDWTVSVLAVVPSTNQPITLSGAITGNGTTGITTSFGSEGPNTVLTNTSATSAAPIALTLGASTVLGRGPTGNITALSFGSVAPLITNITGCQPTSVGGASAASAVCTVGIGSATDSTNSVVISSAGYNWAVSNGNTINGYLGGTSLPTNATVHWYICQGNTGTGSYAVPNSSYPLPAASAPAGYNTYVRRVFSLVTAASGVLMSGGTSSNEIEGGALEIYYQVPILDITTTSLGTVRTAFNISAPSGIKVKPLYRANGTAGGTIILTGGDEADLAPTGSAGNVWTTAPGADIITTVGSNVPFLSSIRDGNIRTNTSGQIGARATTTSVDLYWVTKGWIDPRRN